MCQTECTCDAGLSSGSVEDAVATDFAAVPMLSLAMTAVYAFRRWRVNPPRPREQSPRWIGDIQLCLTVATAFVVCWALYGFQTGPIADGSRIIVPAPGWFRGLVAFLGAQMRSGVEIVTRAVQLERKISGCDLVITGEGRLDGDEGS